MPSRRIQVSPIAAFQDNYIWALHDAARVAVVDPGDAAPALAWLADRGLELVAILLTHHHSDHVGGVAALKAAYPDAEVIGHAADAHRLPPLSLQVGDGDALDLPALGLHFDVIAAPGHTLGHICYFGEGLLFCGDTLFSAGCGRMFEGTPPVFHHSLMLLAALPEATEVFVGHEYTLANLRFAVSLTPSDGDLQRALDQVEAQRSRGLCTLPSSIAWERRHNPFLRCAEPAIARAVGKSSDEAVAVFAALRLAKDRFRSA